MFCHLCEQDKDLIDAHIIPKSFFKEIRPENGQSFLLITDKPYSRKAPNGEYDPNILCAECDRMIGCWDQKAIEFFRSADSWESIEDDNGRARGYIAHHFEYVTLKLFCISLLWRAGISKRPFFQQVQLGPYEQKAKQQILNHDPGKEHQFSVFMTKYASTNLPQYQTSRDVMHKNILSPTKRKFDNTRFYEFTLNEFNVYIKVDNRKLPIEFSPCLLRENYPLNIIEFDFDNSRKHRYLLDAIRSLQK